MDANVERLIEQLGVMVYRRALAVLGDPEDARDAAQDVFIKLMRVRGLREDAAGWLYRVTTNTCLNRLRGRRRAARLLAQHGAGAADSGRSNADVHYAVRALFRGADARCAAAAFFVHVEELSHAQAASRLGVSRRTVGYLLERFEHWARQQLRAQ